MTSPIGTLLVDAEKRAKPKANGHTSTAACGCSVSVAWFSDSSYRAKMMPCPEHATTKGPR